MYTLPLNEAIPFIKCEYCLSLSIFTAGDKLDRVSVPSPMSIDILMDTMARDRVPMYLFSV